MKIGLFDSGIGGLLVLKEFLKKYPNNTYYYYGDTKNLPYGEKDKETLLNLSLKIIKFFEEKQVDIIIIACGTISANCYLELSKKTQIKIYDIISPTIEYVKSLNVNSIGVLATKRTIESHLFKKQLGNNVMEVAALEFVPMIENNQVSIDIIKKYLKDLSNVSVLILGCTHYPLIQAEIQKFLSKETLIVDMGKSLVNKLELSNKGKPNIELYFTKVSSNLLQNVKRIIKEEYQLFEVCDK